MPITPSSTTLHRTRKEVLDELETLQQSDSVLGFGVVLLCGLITYGTYASLNEFTDLSWWATVSITAIAAVFILLIAFAVLSDKTHQRNARRRRTIIRRYENDLMRWLGAHGKTGTLEYQGDILAQQCGMKRIDGSLLEYFTVVDTGEAITIKK